MLCKLVRHTATCRRSDQLIRAALPHLLLHKCRHHASVGHGSYRCHPKSMTVRRCDAVLKLLRRLLEMAPERILTRLGLWSEQDGTLRKRSSVWSMQERLSYVPDQAPAAAEQRSGPDQAPPGGCSVASSARSDCPVMAPGPLGPDQAPTGGCSEASSVRRDCSVLAVMAPVSI